MSDKNPQSPKEEVAKAVKNAGNSVFAIGIFNLVATTLLYLLSGSDDFAYLSLVITGNAVLSIIMIVLGNKIKKDTQEDMEVTLKKIKNATTYTWIMTILTLLLGAFPGVFTILALFDLSKAKKKVQRTFSEK
jgi:metal-dependent amidase/aminoacylase/carboxypeptidase family protein